MLVFSEDLGVAMSGVGPQRALNGHMANSVALKGLPYQIMTLEALFCIHYVAPLSPYKIETLCLKPCQSYHHVLEEVPNLASARSPEQKER